MKYTVSRAFKCKNDGKNYYPNGVYESDEERCLYLKGKGFLGKRVESEEPNFEEAEEVKKVKEVKYPFHTGGGWYELSNGERIRGKEDAEKAESELITSESRQTKQEDSTTETEPTDE